MKNLFPEAFKLKPQRAAVHMLPVDVDKTTCMKKITHYGNFTHIGLRFTPLSILW
jgi:hypothetical protein